MTNLFNGVSIRTFEGGVFLVSHDGNNEIRLSPNDLVNLITVSKDLGVLETDRQLRQEVSCMRVRVREVEAQSKIYLEALRKISDPSNWTNTCCDCDMKNTVERLDEAEEIRKDGSVFKYRKLGESICDIAKQALGDA